MDVTQRGDRTDRSRLGDDLIQPIKRSVLLQLAVTGGLMIVLAAVMQMVLIDPTDPRPEGIWIGMLPIWGTALFVAGLGGYTYIWIQRR